jgi:23S rRNA (guanosine2251-2'-O)-methyltransferase|tara:strand:- start:942 stop:1679 length:738 start_codon:yes stop_codon:yes gene_type:complete
MNKSSYFIVGKHPVIEALKNKRRKIIKIFLTEESKKTIHRESPNNNLLRDKKIYYKTKKELDNYCRNENILHQGFVAEVEKLENIELKEFIKNDKKINLVCLAGATDPRNIGSIIRSASAFNIDGMIVREKDYPETSKLMHKAASGSIEHLNIFNVSNINSTLKFLREKNFWIYGFDAAGDKKLTETKWDGNNVLVFGSEGYGMKKHTEKYLDFVVKIEINNKIESLNLSNSASIVFHHINTYKK